MMIQTFMAMIAFIIALLAFCAGAALTVWATSSRHIGDTAAAKLPGYFVVILSIVALICSSYYVTIGLLTNGATAQQQVRQWTSKDMAQHQMQKSHEDKDQDSKSNSR